MTRILLIGGSGFIGAHVAASLLRQGHDVAVFHRGQTRRSALRLPPVREIHGDRRQLGESATALRAFRPEVVIDCVLSSGRQARELMTVFRHQIRYPSTLSASALIAVHSFIRSL